MNMKSGAARGGRCAAYGRLLRMCLFLCFLCACLLPALSGCRNRRLSAYSYSGGVSVTVGLGTRAPLSPGRAIPVSVAVSGDYAAADHTVTVTVPTGEADFYCYRQQLSGETKTEETITGSMEWDGTQIDGTLTNGLKKDMSQVLVVAGDRVCLLDEWKHGETLTLSGEANAGRGQWVALETYLEGSYRKRDGWDTSCQTLYELLTRSHSLLAYQEFLVVGRIDCDQTVQQNTDYRTSNISFAVAKVRAD